MRILKYTLLTLLGVFVLLVVVGMLLPSKWQVERSIVIQKPAKMIYPFVANFKKGWPQWSAFDTEDPNIQYSYAGPEMGTGAERSWVSNKMGNGSQKITKADPKYGMDYELVMESNKQFTIAGHLIFEEKGEATKVTWRDSGDAGKNPFFRLMASCMDKMMGGVFEKSLATLKSKAEAL